LRNSVIILERSNPVICSASEKETDAERTQHTSNDVEFDEGKWIAEVSWVVRERS